VLSKETNGLRAFFVKGILVAHSRGIATLSLANRVACHEAHASDRVAHAVRSLDRLPNGAFEHALKCAKAQLYNMKAARSIDSKTVFTCLVNFMHEQHSSSDRHAALASVMLLAEKRGFASLSDDKRQRTLRFCMKAEGRQCKRVQSILHLMENGHLLEVICILKDATKRELHRMKARELLEAQRLADELLDAFLERELPPSVLRGADEPDFSF
jgi:hypothetical protein